MLLNRRYLRIVTFFARLALHIIWWEILMRRLGFRNRVRKTGPSRYLQFAKDFRRLAVQMGGVLIKVGQFASSRVDVLPTYVIDELSGLQDEVPAEDFSVIAPIIESELDCGIDGLFDSIESKAVAAASLGQVHSAVLKTGEKVVIKVQRPDIHRIVAIDLAAMRTAIGWLKHWKLVSQRADVMKLFNEFSVVLLEELDYVSEANNAVRFAEIFADDPGVRIPAVYHEYSTRRVLTLEDVAYIKFTDYEQIDAAGVPRSEVAERLIRTYFHQIFISHFFHADPHPGNLFVEPAADDHEWRLVFVDFGMVGKISAKTRHAIREVVIGVGTRDPERFVQAFIELDALLPSADIKRIVEVETAVFEKFWGKSMEELTQIDPMEIHKIAYDFRDLIYEMPFQMPDNLIYLGRCVAILSGMTTGIDPNFNLFSVLGPYVETLLSEEEGGFSVDFLVSEIKKVGYKLIAVPGRVDRILQLIERGDFQILTHPSPDFMDRLDAVTKALYRLPPALISVALILAGAYLYAQDQDSIGLVAWALAGVFFAATYAIRGETNRK